MDPRFLFLPSIFQFLQLPPQKNKSCPIESEFEYPMPTMTSRIPAVSLGDWPVLRAHSDTRNLKSTNNSIRIVTSLKSQKNVLKARLYSSKLLDLH